MPPFPYQSVAEIRGRNKPRLPEAFFSATEEEIVEALVAGGYSRKTAQQEAALFMEYKAKLSTPQADWADDETEQVPVEAPEYESFGEAIAKVKKEGQRDEQ